MIDIFGKRVCLFLLIFLAGGAISGWHPMARSEGRRFSKISGIQASFDTLIRDSKQKTITLKGHVQAVLDKYYLYCDEAIIQSEKKEIICTGHVILQSEDTLAEAEKMRLNYDTNTGALYDAYVQSGQVVFNGEVIYKLGPDTYEASKGIYTACTTCPPAWSFSGERIQATLGEYAIITNPIIRFVNIPVLWSPVDLILPLKTQRQTGFLIPSLDFSNTGGWAINIKYFWAMNRSQDATISTKYYQHRGLKAATNYRYVLSSESRGEVDTAYIRDRLFGATLAQPQDPFDRWFLKYNHTYNLPHDFIQRVRLNLVSDLRYPRDFSEDIEGHGDPALENRFSISHNTTTQHASLDSAIYVNLLKSQAITENKDAVHRFPELRYSLTPSKVGSTSLNFSLDAVFSTFFRNYFSYDDLETVQINGESVRQVSAKRDGTFNAEDLIRTGQRLDFQPKVTYPLHIQQLDILPSLAYHGTWYQFGIPKDNPDRIPDTYDRKILRAEVSARTRFSRIYGDLQDDKKNRYKHEIIPELTFTSIPWIDAPSHAFFGSATDYNFNRSQAISEADLNSNTGIQFDYFDRVYDRNLLSLTLSNHWIRRIWSNDVATYSRIATARLSQSYDLYQASRGGKFPASDLSALIDVRLEHFETNTLFRYYPYHGVINTSARVKFINDAGHFIQTSFTQNFSGMSNETTTVSYADRTESINLSAGWGRRLFNFKGEVEFNNVTQVVQSWSYSIDISPPGDCWGLTFTQKHVTGGATTLFIDLLYNLDGRNLNKLPKL